MTIKPKPERGQILGPCEFSELPQPYQNQFEAGTIHRQKGQFYPYQAGGVAVFLAVFLGLVYLLPALMVIYMTLDVCFTRPDLVRRVLSDMFSGILPFLGLTAIFGVLIGVTWFMLLNGLRAVIGAVVFFEIKEAAADDKRHYGLLLDQHSLVYRHGDYFEDHQCVFLPKKQIEQAFVGVIRVEGAKRSYNKEVVKIHYRDEGEQVRALILKVDFSTPVKTLADQIQRWLADETIYGSSNEGLTP